MSDDQTDSTYGGFLKMMLGDDYVPDGPPYTHTFTPSYRELTRVERARKRVANWLWWLADRVAPETRTLPWFTVEDIPDE